MDNRIRIITLCSILIIAGGMLFGAYLRFEPVEVTQPDGTVLKLFASGDEYYNWMHDKDGYTIRQNDKGWYVYLDKDSKDELINTDLIVGIHSPHSRNLPPWINISAEKMGQIRNKALTELREIGAGKAPTSGTLNNLVVFIRFADQAEFGQSITTYSSMFNGTTGNTMQNYFMEASYNMLNISTTFYPTPTSMVVSWQDTEHVRNYFVPYSTTNTIGYSTDTERRLREHALLVSAINGISSQVPTGLNLDGDNDGEVDNVCFVIQGATTAWSTLLWPHRWALYSYTVNINGKRVYDYNFQLSNSLSSSGNGVLCHEMFHSLGAPDLYHYTSNGITPVGGWDLMESNANPPEHMTAFMKQKYGHWISSIPVLNSAGTYSINSLISSTNNCYRINSPNSTTEYFILEFRKKTGTFESSVPGTGMIIYRINTTCGDGNADGPPDEVYVYRLNGTPSVNGTISSATFSAETGRTSFTNSTNPYCFLSNGNFGNIAITSIGSSAGTTISFAIDYIPPQNLTAVPSHCKVALSWQSPGFFNPSSYKIFRNGSLLTTVTELNYNDTNVVNGTSYTYYVKAVFTNPPAESGASNSVIATPIALPPQNLSGTVADGICLLNWQAPIAGTPTSYRVYRNSVFLASTSNRTYNDNTVINNTLYSYYVKASYANPTTESAASNTIYLTPVNDLQLTIASGSVTGQGLPMNPTKQYSYSQSIVLQSEINETSRAITRLSYQYIGGGVYTDSIKIYMGHTDLSAFASSSSWVPLSSMRLVYSGNITTTSTASWIELILNTPFVYNNTQNLVIAFDENKPGFQTGGFYSTSVSGYRSLVKSDDAINPDPAAPPIGTRKTYLPNLKLYLVTVMIPRITFNPTSLSFGDLALGTSAQQSFTIQNTGNANLMGNIFTPTGYTIRQARGEAERNSMGYTILSGQSLNLTITFTPIINQAYNDNLTITSNDPDNLDIAYPVSGMGVVPPNLELSTLSLSENLILGAESSLSLNMQNAGGMPLNYSIQITEPQIRTENGVTNNPENSSFRPVSWLTCSSLSGSIPAGQMQILNLCFTTLNSTPGLNMANLIISSNDPAHPSITVTVSLNTMLASPVIEIEKTDIAVRLSWSGVTGANQYKIYSSITPFGVFEYLDTTNNLYYNCTYGQTQCYYKVVAIFE